MLRKMSLNGKSTALSTEPPQFYHVSGLNFQDVASSIKEKE